MLQSYWESSDPLGYCEAGQSEEESQESDQETRVQSPAANYPCERADEETTTDGNIGHTTGEVCETDAKALDAFERSESEQFQSVSGEIETKLAVSGTVPHFPIRDDASVESSCAEAPPSVYVPTPRTQKETVQQLLCGLARPSKGGSYHRRTTQQRDQEGLLDHGHSALRPHSADPIRTKRQSLSRQSVTPGLLMEGERGEAGSGAAASGGSSRPGSPAPSSKGELGQGQLSLEVPERRTLSSELRVQGARPTEMKAAKWNRARHPRPAWRGGGAPLSRSEQALLERLGALSTQDRKPKVRACRDPERLVPMHETPPETSRTRRVRESVREREKQLCTFHPRINRQRMAKQGPTRLPGTVPQEPSSQGERRDDTGPPCDDGTLMHRPCTESAGGVMTVFERCHEWQQTKERELAWKRAKQQRGERMREEEECPFHPSLCPPNSHKIALSMASKTDVLSKATSILLLGQSRQDFYSPSPRSVNKPPRETGCGNALSEATTARELSFAAPSSPTESAPRRSGCVSGNTTRASLLHSCRKENDISPCKTFRIPWEAHHGRHDPMYQSDALFSPAEEHELKYYDRMRRARDEREALARRKDTNNGNSWRNKLTTPRAFHLSTSAAAWSPRGTP
eukprot:scaffold3793_cov397-Prasinococcus_capsulatus_cf.AAC.8